MISHSLSQHKNIITVFTTLILLPLIFFSTTEGMVSVWESNETFTHGFLIFPIVFWLVWQKRNLLKQANNEIEYRVLIFIIPILGLWYLSSITDVQITQQFALILLIQFALWFLLGREVIKLILFPVLFLFFAVPFGQSLIPPLMEFTANFTVLMVQLTGIPIYQEGLFFTLPSGNWSVVEECSGVRYLIASAVLGTLFAYTSYSSKKKIIIFIIISLLVPILANSLRAFGIVMIGHFSGMTLATGVDHLIYGWIFFGVVIFLLFVIGSYWADPLETFKQPPPKSPHNVQQTPLNVLFLHQVGLYLVIAFIIYGLIPSPTMSPENRNIQLPEHFANWQQQKDRSIEWTPVISNPDVFVSGAYLFDQDLVQLNIGYYAQQKNGAEAVSSMNHIASPLGGKWKKLTGTDIQHKRHYVTETELKYGHYHVLVWHWYQIGAYETPNPYIAKLFDAYNLIINKRNDAAMITISTVVTTNKLTSREVLKDFLNTSSTSINKLIH